MGRLTDDASRKTAAAVREFDTRVLAGEDPMMVADDLYDRDTLMKAESRAGNQGFDTSDINGTIKQAGDNFKVMYKKAKDSGNQREMESLEAQYNREAAMLKNIRDLQISQQQFDDTLKRVQ